MKKEQAYKLIASSFGLGNIKTQAKLWASAVAFALALAAKQFESLHLVFYLLITVGMVLSYISIRHLRNNNIQTNIVADDFLGTWIALAFSSGSLLLNFFALLSYQLLSVFKPILSQIKLRSRFSIESMRTSIITGIAANFLVQAVLLAIYWSK